MQKLQPPPNPPRIGHLTLSHQHPSKNRGPIKLPLFENLVRASTPHASRKRGDAHYDVNDDLRDFSYSEQSNEE